MNMPAISQPLSARFALIATLAFITLAAWLVLGASSAPRVSFSLPTEPRPEPRAVEGAGEPGHRVESGLLLSIKSAAGNVRDQRVARMASLYVGEHDAPTPFLEPGAFVATWDGWIVLEGRNTVTFSAEGIGQAALTVNGTEALTLAGPQLAGAGQAVRLEKGRNRLHLVYTSPANGAARMRLLWSSAEFPAEPVPPTVFMHEETDILAAPASLRHGRELIGSMRCTHCHASAADAATGMPELATDAPDLRAAGAQFNSAWMAAWIRDPTSMRPTATMPRLLHGPEAPQQASDIAAYLATLGTAAPDTAFTEPEEVAGARRFAVLGCVACHTANADGPAHVDLSRVRAKWKPAALVDFLRQPAKHYQWTRMPTFGFNAHEARELAAYLLSREQQEVAPSVAGDATRGKALIASSRCVSCHELGGGTKLPAPPLTALRGKTASGCLAPTAAGRRAAPEFPFAATEADDLRAFLATDQVSLTRRTLSEFAERRVVALRCIACHERDGNDALLSAFSAEADAITAALPPEDAGEEHGESGAAAGNPCPPLTFIGDKLRPEWMGAFIAGKLKYRPRPWLAKRMPAFPAAADLLAQGLAEQHGHPAVTPTETLDHAGPSAAIGKQLTSATGGLACIACHGIGKQAPIAVFEAPGVNLGYAVQRLQKDFFLRWMKFPTRFDPNTRMPRFAADDGSMPLKDILGGEADAQFEAIWRHLNEVNQQTDFTH